MTGPPDRGLPEDETDLVRELVRLAGERLEESGSVDERIWRSLDAAFDLVIGTERESLVRTT